jgi:exopolysaccharide biosynthesis protein
MVAQKSDATNSGMSLMELADYMKSLGVEKAMNLDGGSSSSLYWDGKAFYGKRDGQGAWVVRSVKSVLLMQ